EHARLQHHCGGHRGLAVFHVGHDGDVSQVVARGHEQPSDLEGGRSPPTCGWRSYGTGVALRLLRWTMASAVPPLTPITGALKDRLAPPEGARPDLSVPATRFVRLNAIVDVPVTPRRKARLRSATPVARG